jgi:hypothetical protein
MLIVMLLEGLCTLLFLVCTEQNMYMLMMLIKSVLIFCYMVLCMFGLAAIKSRWFTFLSIFKVILHKPSVIPYMRILFFYCLKKAREYGMAVWCH